MSKSTRKRTTVGVIDQEVLAFTAGKDVVLDLALVQADCLGSAAHATMLSRMPIRPPLFNSREVKRIVDALCDIMRRADRGGFAITLEDQDVHLAVERTLTETLGDLGKKIHTGRSRNDQVALDLRLYGRDQLLGAIQEATDLATELRRFGEKHVAVPMVGRTHMQPGMPSSVGLWATAFSESLLDDIALLMQAYEINDKSPLGSAASYGVPLPIDRALVADLLGFSGPCHNVLYANNSRGKVESVILMAMSQVMLTLSRLAQDLMLFTMPEFGYFELPAAFCTGSSIMPQKKNPDVLELVRAKATRVFAGMTAAYDLVKASPTGYNRDLQEAKEVFMEGIHTTRSSLRIVTAMMTDTSVNAARLIQGFTPDVFATDRALELVSAGMPFRDAYHYVKENLHELESVDPHEAIARKKHLGATAGLDFAQYDQRLASARAFVENEQEEIRKVYTKLLGRKFPLT
ncbi:MAG TPA: argininosuccinate lyase [Kiritimatiellia bacterium]|nr:argininosuccinate lyase [Kiritimatiellia bacterium]HMO99286.1 argininosuccinate lyase [Kiritimatiellia bacterium]HMP95618.1 argininosuccinate lyase [Kiritimatiellia bacterium]